MRVWLLQRHLRFGFRVNFRYRGLGPHDVQPIWEGTVACASPILLETVVVLSSFILAALHLLLFWEGVGVINSIPDSSVPGSWIISGRPEVGTQRVMSSFSRRSPVHPHFPTIVLI